VFRLSPQAVRQRSIDHDQVATEVVSNSAPSFVTSTLAMMRALNVLHRRIRAARQLYHPGLQRTGCCRTGESVRPRSVANRARDRSPTSGLARDRARRRRSRASRLRGE
jgi:hypothetical protein